MKKARIAVVLFLGIMLMSGLACGEGGESVPTPTPTVDQTAMIRATINDFFDALDKRDKERFESMLAEGAEEWLTTLAMAETLQLRFEVNTIGELQIDDGICLVEVTTTTWGEGVFQPKEPTTTDMMRLVLEDNSWKVSVSEE